ncbi:predicted protein [Uncinocarpus reesii 1704]|uniref:Uncharacterized protein n=1 Tax=Uncinocarpus reesii (strain UAMH 1704) TaxID=336963 RepID=C4JKF7_UNCRE|nr:uncharacterized protein UREG_02114 [Uncinocarpus reesii 1704]EEP77265.1 predicted protein [Uncinocarpus reesii 1704]
MVQSMKGENRQNIPSSNESQGRSMTESDGKGNGRRRTQVAVNSSVVHARGPYVTLPCPVLSSNGALSAGGMHPGSYDQHVLSRPSPIALHSAPGSCSPYSMLHSSFDFAPGNGSNFAHRSSYISGYSMNYDDDTSYQVQQPHSNLLAHGNIGDGNTFSSTAGTKSWYETCQTKSLHGVFAENDSNNPMAGSGYPFMLQQPHTPVPNDNVSVFPLVNSFPTGLTSSDRTLPNPVGYRNSSFPAATSISEIATNVSMGSGQMPSYKSSWGVDKTFSHDIHISRASSSATSSTTSSDRSRPSPSSPSDIGFGYISITSNPPVPTMPTSTCTVPEIMNLSERYHTAGESRHLNGSQGGGFSESYTPDMYTYGRGRGSRPTLISGHVYVRNPADSEPITVSRPEQLLRPAPPPPPALVNAEVI